MKSQSKLTLFYGISNKYDLFKKLKYDLNKLLNEANLDRNITIYNTFNFLITAWHLHNDWTKEKSIYIEKKEKLPYEFKELIKAIKYLANGSKHKELTKGIEKNPIQEATKPIITNYYDYIYGEQVTIKINDKYESLSLLTVPLMDYFEWLLDDNKTADEIPNSVDKFSFDSICASDMIN